MIPRFEEGIEGINLGETKLIEIIFWMNIPGKIWNENQLFL
ncbi:hypothetical protein CLERM_192 [Coxiella-like endosymbiont]|nr:hypothetical protein CLERM_192 [Coxiella-like endosymbiont]